MSLKNVAGALAASATSVARSKSTNDGQNYSTSTSTSTNNIHKQSINIRLRNYVCDRIAERGLLENVLISMRGQVDMHIMQHEQQRVDYPFDDAAHMTTVDLLSALEQNEQYVKSMLEELRQLTTNDVAEKVDSDAIAASDEFDKVLEDAQKSDAIDAIRYGMYLDDDDLEEQKALPLDEVEPHDYHPSAMHMGDCSVCGNVQDHPLHIAERRESGTHSDDSNVATLDDQEEIKEDAVSVLKRVGSVSVLDKLEQMYEDGKEEYEEEDEVQKNIDLSAQDHEDYLNDQDK